MSHTDTEWPTHSQELSRKALETLERAVHKNVVEQTMTDDELWLVADTLVDTVQGLVPADVTDTIYGVRKGLRKCP